MTEERQVKNSSAAITIKMVRLKELQAFAGRIADDPSGGHLLPISQARVRSQIHNPFGDGDDVALITAFRGSCCVGYLGLLPGICSIDGRFSKVFWGTTLLVSPTVRGRGVGKLLVAAMQGLGIDFIGTCMTESAEKLYYRMGMKPLGTLNYCQLRMEKVKRLLPGRGEIRKPEKGHRPRTMVESMSLPLYRLLKTMFYGLLLSSFRPGSASFVAREVERIAELPGFAGPGIAEPVFYRPIEVVNWMLSYPWVFSRTEKIEKSEYYFSTSRDLFAYKAFHIESAKEQRLLGFVVISVLTHKGRTVVKVLDHAFLDPDALHMVMVVALRCARQFRADRIEYDTLLSRYLPGWLAEKRFVKKQERLYLFHPRDENSPLLQHRERFHLCYGDGDIGFA
jgi:GNAT superfamily N-acetyltransferase